MLSLRAGLTQRLQQVLERYRLCFVTDVLCAHCTNMINLIDLE